MPHSPALDALRSQAARMMMLAAGAALALAGCGTTGTTEAEDQPSPTAHRAAPAHPSLGNPYGVAPTDDASAASSGATASSGASDQPTTTSAGSSAPASTAPAPSSAAPSSAAPSSSGPAGAATAITYVWPDSSWDIADYGSDDPCRMSTPSPSPFGAGADYFMCGSTAASLRACKHTTGDEALCVNDPADKKATRIHSASAKGFHSAAPKDPSPVGAVLADGTVCSPMNHDHGQHYQNRMGWLSCSDDRVLLTDEATQSHYFDTSKPVWTAEAVPASGPVPSTQVQVREVRFVATPDDAQALTRG